MIVELHKYLILGPRQEMDRFFSLAQRAGFLEFIGLSHKKALELPEPAKHLMSAIKIARQHTASSQDAYVPELEPEKLAEVIIALNESHEKLLEEERVLNTEIARISIFGNFSRQELDLLEREGKRVFQFFCMKSDLAREMSLPPNVIYVGTEYDLDYFVAINKEPTQYPKMIEIQIERPAGDLRERLHFVRGELSRLEKELHDSANALPYLQSGLLDCLNDHHLRLSKHDAVLLLNDTVFAIEAWVPKTRIKPLFGLLSGLNIHAELIATEAKDVVPTYMENKGIGKIGEDLVHIYDTPAATDKDPSLWVFFFFSLFFAVIVSDAGYGFVYLLIGLFIQWKMPKLAGSGRRLVRLVFMLSSCCIVWGVLTASYFGIEISPNNPIRKTSFIHYLAVKKADYHMSVKDDVYERYAKSFPAVETATDGHDFLLKASTVSQGKTTYKAMGEFYDNILLECAILIGLIHIALSFIRSLGRNWGGLGWVIFMIGGYLFFPSILNATSIVNFMGWIPKPLAKAIGQQMVYAGLAFVFIAALFQKKKWGAFNDMTQVIQVFGDVLSYLRLYALALAGMIMASTFNQMGRDLGLFLGALVILFGHVLNMGMSLMAGVIHGLRLNFLEWYHYSFEGGGRLFNPLRLRKTK